MAINKKDVIQLLEHIAVYMELKGENPFRIAAYRKAATSLERDERSLEDIDDFKELNGVGKGTDEVIREYIESNHSSQLEKLKEEVPAGLVPLLKLPGLGGKKLHKLYKELNIVDATSLKAALESKQVQSLSGFGKKSSENILNALEEANKRPERLPIQVMLPIAEHIEAQLEAIQEVNRFSRAGSLRRVKETIGDLDFIIATTEPVKVRDALLRLENIKEIIAKGETKVSVTIVGEYDINVDFRLVSDKQFATTLHHFTGSKEHNVAMRQLAKSRGEKISEYGVEVEETNQLLTFNTEKDFFNHFGLHFIPPEARENTGEVDMYTKQYPLIDLTDIRGDLHMHTTWSDGGQSIDEMVQRAMAIGYEYIAITDHSKFLRVANGLNEMRLRKQREEIDRINEKYDNIHVFAGVEMDILPDGTLDFTNDFLKEMDFVIGAIHSGFNQSEEKIMYRLQTALENPYVSLIAHPTGRLIGKRNGYQLDVEKLIAQAKETHTALEINANPNRLDLNSDWARKAGERGVTIAINTDAHSFPMLTDMKYGVSTAKRGWIKREMVLNTWSVEDVKLFLKRKR
ncbi:MAG TPA: DNA polymerase/3'-5' exonuclease PolX [Bacillota bacterium]|nr:DNA polymerase/3'-5' exonuclease PolX [Bacillota bacterium]